MLPGPIFRREVKAAARGSGLFAYRVLVGAFVGGVAAAAGLVMFGPGTGPTAGPAVYEAGSLRAYALIVLAATLGIQVTFVALLAAAVVGAAIAEEREKDTLPLLLLTRLTRLELAATKLAGRLVPVFLQLLTGLPLLAIAAWGAGLPAPLVVEILAAMASTIAVAGSLGILASSRKARSAAAQQEAAGWTMFWLVVLPLVARMPARSGTIWGDLLVELRRLASWIAPSSPLSLLVDWSWFSGGPDLAGPLSDRLRTMLAIQAAVFAFGLLGSVVGLRLREPHPTAWDPHRGYRPPVGDDPIYWREYELPWRGSRLPVAVILARQLLIIIRMLLLLSFQAVFLAVAVAIPIGLLIASGYYSYIAFREWWGYDPYPPGIGGSPRDQLNFFLRIVTSMLGLMPMLFAGAVADRIMFERNKKTWEPLLTTPLTGPEILGSKMRVTAWFVWSMIRWLILLWLLGIVCGGLHPLGVLVAAAGLAAGVWLNLAIGVRVAIRPGATTRSVNYTAVLWVLAMFPVGGLTIVAPLCSARDLDALRAIDPNLPWRAVAVLLAVALALASLAWSLIRRCFRRFDEWVGRPHRASGTSNEPVLRSTAADSVGILDRSGGRDTVRA